MKFRNLVKKIAAYVCMATMVVGSMAGVGQVTASAEEAAVSDDIILNGDASGASSMIGYSGESGYKYQFATLKDAPADYKYLVLTYSGSIANLRMEFAYVGAEGETAKVGPYWFNPDQAVKFTTVGDALMDTVEQGTVVIDLEATGLSLADYNSVHIHNDVTAVKIGYARLSKSSDVKADVDVMPEEPETTPAPEDVVLEPVELTGFVGVWAPAGNAGDYAYLTGVDVNAVAGGYKYLELTYKGDATAFKELRFEFSGIGTYGIGEVAHDGAMVTVDGTAVPTPTAEEQTVTIDLEATGLDITKAISAIHMHQTAGNGSFEITKAVLTAPAKPVELENVKLEGLINTWAPEGDAYAYLTGVDVNAAAGGYKYLKLSYTGDATAFNDLRMEFSGIGTYGLGVNAYDGAMVTVDGTAVPAPAAEAQTVVIDLAATGMDITKAITAIHLHQTAGNGSFTITDAELLVEYTAPVDPSTLEDIILNGDEAGLSTMIKKWTVAKPAAGDQYKYIGFATLKEPTSDYKYLILTYTGDIGSIRWEFATVDANGNETAKVGPYWFNKEGQEKYFVTADGSDIPLDGGKGTTIVIDLEATGIDLGTYNSVHMHAGYGPDAKDITFQIGMARLSTKADISAIDTMPTENPTTTIIVEPTSEDTTTAKKDVKPPKKAKVKSASKKKASKKVKISIKKVKGAKGYRVQISTNKKFKKKLVNKIVARRNVTISSKKIKNKKKLYVRVKAYKLDGKKKVWAKKWSKAKKVTIKK